MAQSLQQKRGSETADNSHISAPSQAIMRRSALWVTPKGVKAKLTVELPALGRHEVRAMPPPIPISGRLMGDENFGKVTPLSKILAPVR